ncbi:hypothetical protein F5888DRAFT_1632952 [Russula emetica]|nr:hypothetical protein F5888DRAFT_1632952 [Russula emetica]
MISSINSLPESRRSLANGNGAREVKTTRPGDEAAPEQDGDGADVQLHSHERRKKELETMAITFRALDRGLKYIQDSLLIRLRAKVVGAEAGGLGVRGEMWGLVCSAAARAPSKRPVQNRATEQPTPERPATTVQFHTLVYHHFTHSLFIIASRSSPLPRPLVQDNSEWI